MFEYKIVTIQYNTIQYNTIQYNTIQYKNYFIVPEGKFVCSFRNKYTSNNLLKQIQINKLLKQYVNLDHDEIKN